LNRDGIRGFARAAFSLVPAGRWRLIRPGIRAVRIFLENGWRRREQTESGRQIPASAAVDVALR